MGGGGPTREIATEDARSVELPTVAVTDRGPDPAIAVAAGVSLGRYVVIERVGAGGMGIVYRAYDPKLGREVAVKVLRVGKDAEITTEASRRMLREARAMARLAHPNVVPVYDVEAGEGQLFLVMEYVQGQTLRGWQRGGPRGWTEILAAFRQAGEGLASAHAAGIIHRDFKPGNAIVGDEADGVPRVRVMDFGLARAAERHDSEEFSAGLSPASSISSASVSLEEPVTEVGVVVGTPAYMAPEQHRGHGADAKSDQYAFCVALYEALFGERPFRGKGKDLLRRKETLELEVPATTGVPRWLHRAVLRGLAPDPAQRWPSMRALLSELSRDLSRGRRWLAWAAAATGIAAASAFALGLGDEDPCGSGDAIVADLWDEAAQTRVHEAFDATALPYADAAWAGVDERLRGFAAQWAQGHRDACEATRVRGEQSETRFDRRMQCLSGRLHTARSLVEVLSDADVRIVQGAISATNGLPAVRRCGEPAYLDEVVPPPPEAIREEVSKHREALARTEALRLSGGFEEGLTNAIAVARRGEELGYAPLVDEANLNRGTLLLAAGRFEEAHSLLVDAYYGALRRGHIATAFNMTRLLLFLAGERRTKIDEAEVWFRHGDALWHQSGGDDLQRATLLSDYGSALMRFGSLERAEEMQREALALFEKVEEPMQVAIAHNNLANTFYQQGRPSAAVEHHRQALAIWEAVLGSAHPFVGTSLNNLANAMADVTTPEDALEVFARALEVRRAALRPTHPEIALTLNNMAAITLQAGRPAEAVALAQEAIELFSHELGEDHVWAGALYESLGLSLQRDGRFDDAEAAFERSLAIRTKAVGPDDYITANSVARLGVLKARRGDLDGARSDLESAYDTIASVEGSPVFTAEYEFELARVLWAIPEYRPRAAALAGTALARLASSEVRAHQVRTELAAWTKNPTAKQPKN